MWLYEKGMGKVYSTNRFGLVCTEEASTLGKGADSTAPKPGSSSLHSLRLWRQLLLRNKSSNVILLPKTHPLQRDPFIQLLLKHYQYTDTE